MTLSIKQQFFKLGLEQQGGLYRPLPLLTLSCICYGYGRQLQRISGLTYGPIGAVGNGKGWRTLLNIDDIVGRISLLLEHDKQWLAKTRKLAQRRVREFEKLTMINEKYIKIEPEVYLRFIIKSYPKYLSVIGAYNLFLRYLEYAKPTQAPFPKTNLHKLAFERDESAKIYPRCEKNINRALSNISKTLGATSGQLSMMTCSELNATLKKGRLAVSRYALNKRRKNFIYLSSDGKESVQVGSAAAQIVRQYKSAESVTHDIRGRSVFAGKCLGTVIRTLDRKKWPPKPIYVTAMTRPDDTHYAKRLKAIVTDEGGILCHAAVLAREFRIPCIIGTKIVTRVLKDGDKVVVDATQGIVRKI